MINCPMCSFDSADRLIDLNEQIQQLEQQINDNRQMCQLSIKAASQLLDKLQGLRQERSNIIQKFEQQL